MLESCWGNLLEADAEALVNTVNCVGVMGKGLALQFKQTFPENFRQYQQACRNEEVRPGQMFIVPTGRLDNPRYIINFPTKRHWKNPSRLEDIKTGLQALVAEAKRLDIHSIAIPPLGCGNGGLDWSRVAPLIESAFAELPEVKVLVFEPQTDSTNSSAPVTPASNLEMTRARALLICLMEQYSLLDYPLTVLEVQRLAYLLQAAGEPLRLQFMKGQYGPYAEKLHSVLQQLEGHFIKGYRAEDDWAVLQLLPIATEIAHVYLADSPAATDVLNRVSDLMEGFESQYGLEMLTITHWVTQEDPKAAASFEKVISKVQDWSPRQRELMKPQHVRKVWQRLHEQRWLLTAELA
jgi:O-acetyl-ADP-ribose deacetylase (regulator of RNase III)